MRQQQKAPIDYQLDYMERLFYKMKFKEDRKLCNPSYLGQIG